MRTGPTSWHVLLLSLGLLTPGVTAQEAPLVTDRPDFTESAEVVPPGLAQLEGGYTFVRDDGVSAHALGELLLRLPLLSRLEARFGLNSLLVEADPGAGRTRYEGLGLGVKVKLLHRRAGAPRWQPSVAVLGGALVPLAGEVGGDVVGSGRMAAAWELTSRLGLGANLGLVSGSDDGVRFTQALASVSGGLTLTGTTGVFIEYFGLHPETARGPNRPFVNAGVTQRLAAGLQLDARLGTALTGPSAVFVGVGFAVRW